MKRLVLIFCAVIMFFSACKKDSNTSDNSCKLSADALIGSWQFSDATYKQTSSSSPIDIFNDTWFYSCVLDDYTTFNADGTYNYVDAGTTCSPNGNVNSTWHLSNDTLYTNGSYNVPNVIDTFSCSRLVISVKDFDVSGDEAFLVYLKKS